jgi:hypothetical protein
MVRWVGLVLSACMAVSAQQFPTQDVPKQQPIPAGQDNGFLQLLPGLRQAPAPDWVQQGARLTYYSGAASIPQGRNVYYRDEDGQWVDDQGNRYREEETTGTGGHGYTQIDVTALQPQAAVLSVRSWGFVNGNTNGGVLPLGAAAGIGLPGAGGDFWLSPAVLQQIQPSNQQGLRIMPMPYPLGNQTFDAVRFHYTQGGNEQVWVFDKQSGVLLYSGSVTMGALANAQTQEGGAGVQKMMTVNIFKGLRPLDLPWRAAQASAVAQQMQALHYEGTLTVTIPGSPQFPLKQEADIQVTQRGPNWILYNQTDTVGRGNPSGVPPQTSQSMRAAGPGQIGGLWLPPEGLANLQPGQTLDQDPQTGIRTVVGQAPNGQRPVVVISEQGQSFTAEYCYDKETGLMVGLAYQDRVLNYTTQMQLASGS